MPYLQKGTFLIFADNLDVVDLGTNYVLVRWMAGNENQSDDTVYHLQVNDTQSQIVAQLQTNQ